jgi:MerR family mercuric resistance operon transcriptional regulator
MSSGFDQTVTIGHLTRAANVGVESVRYYQKLNLFAVPQRLGPYRQYPIALIGCIRFIKRAKVLELTLIPLEVAF